jgi:putative DNA primase/helicase
MTHPTLGPWHKPKIVELDPSDFKKREVYKDYLKLLSEEEIYDDGRVASIGTLASGIVGAPEFSEDQLALRFVSRHGADLRYVAAWGKWFAWTGQVWQHEDTLAVYDLARKICRKASSECNKQSEGKAIARAKTVAAIEQLAKSDRAIASTIGQWDAVKSLLNLPRDCFILSKRENTMAPNADRRLDYCTKVAAVDADENCPIPIFLNFLDTIFAGDTELIDYIQKVLGYCLTGETREHAMFFGYGTGANGKSVLLSTVAGIMNDYCKTAHADTFTITGSNQHPTDVAGLMGARLVICPEVEQGRRWAETKIKSLTGGDKISARFMRQDFFEYVPQFKLFITGNHKPGLRNVDEAMRRRFHLIPFTVTIPVDERDPRLAEKLKAEWPGILAWMIVGARRWYAEGLDKPRAVEDATREYLEAEDTMLAWIEDKCECGKNKYATAGELFASWKAWAELNGEFVGTAKAFALKLEGHGFEQDRLGADSVRIWRGLGLVETVQPSHWNDEL